MGLLPDSELDLLHLSILLSAERSDPSIEDCAGGFYFDTPRDPLEVRDVVHWMRGSNGEAIELPREGLVSWTGRIALWAETDNTYTEESIRRIWEISLCEEPDESWHIPIEPGTVPFDEERLRRAAEHAERVAAELEAHGMEDTPESLAFWRGVDAVKEVLKVEFGDSGFMERLDDIISGIEEPYWEDEPDSILGRREDI